MLKGINKNVLVINSDANSSFESVYFVLRRGISRDKADIVKEANRIIHDSGLSRKKKRKRARTFLSFLLGVLLGGTLSALVCLMLVIC